MTSSSADAYVSGSSSNRPAINVQLSWSCNERAPVSEINTTNPAAVAENQPIALTHLQFQTELCFLCLLAVLMHGLLSIGLRDSIVVSVLDWRSIDCGFGSRWPGLSRSNRGPVALCTLGLGLLNPPSLNGR